MTRSEQRKFYRDLNAICTEWYGRNRANSELALFFGNETKLGTAMNEVLGELQSADVLSLTRIQTAWNEIAGEQAAAITRPLRFENGALTVEISHPSWLRELGGRKLEAVFVANVNRVLGGDHCRNVYIVPVGRYGPNPFRKGKEGR